MFVVHVQLIVEINGRPTCHWFCVSAVHVDESLGVPRGEHSSGYSSCHSLGIHLCLACLLQQLVLHARYVDA